MGKYTAMPCSHCKHTFSEGDDVVVCPICGAPHHRSCYREKGSCAMEKEHETEGYAWQMPLDDPNAITVICGACQTKNFAESVYCRNCSARLDKNIELPQDKKPVNPKDRYSSQIYKTVPNADAMQSREQWSVEGVSAREISTYIGQSGSPYFLPQFHRMSKAQGGVGWNWPAFFFKFAYFFYRRMYKEGFAVLSAYLLIVAPSFIYSMENITLNSFELFGVTLPHNAELFAFVEKFMPVVGILNLLLSFSCGYLANKIYFEKVIKDIKVVRDNGNAPAGGRDYYAILQMRGRPNLAAVLVVAGMFFMAFSWTFSYLAEIAGLLP